MMIKVDGRNQCIIPMAEKECFHTEKVFRGLQLLMQWKLQLYYIWFCILVSLLVSGYRKFGSEAKPEIQIFPIPTPQR